MDTNQTEFIFNVIIRFKPNPERKLESRKSHKTMNDALRYISMFEPDSIQSVTIERF